MVEILRAWTPEHVGFDSQKLLSHPMDPTGAPNVDPDTSSWPWCRRAEHGNIHYVV